MNRLKENCICDKDAENMDVVCPYHGQEALKMKLGYYCTACGGSGYVRQKNRKFPIIKCPFCRE
jgi:ribosomal protein L33